MLQEQCPQPTAVLLINNEESTREYEASQRATTLRLLAFALAISVAVIISLVYATSYEKKDVVKSFADSALVGSQTKEGCILPFLKFYCNNLTIYNIQSTLHQNCESRIENAILNSVLNSF